MKKMQVTSFILHVTLSLTWR